MNKKEEQSQNVDKSGDKKVHIPRLPLESMNKKRPIEFDSNTPESSMQYDINKYEQDLPANNSEGSLENLEDEFTQHVLPFSLYSHMERSGHISRDEIDERAIDSLFRESEKRQAIKGILPRKNAIFNIDPTDIPSLAVKKRSGSKSAKRASGSSKKPTTPVVKSSVTISKKPSVNDVNKDAIKKKVADRLHKNPSQVVLKVEKVEKKPSQEKLLKDRSQKKLTPVKSSVFTERDIKDIRRSLLKIDKIKHGLLSLETGRVNKSSGKPV